MNIIGIAAEYNPFHNGHSYQLSYLREKKHADYCIAVMSGDFVQRGAPAIYGKHLRTRMALSGGVDAVFELPAGFSCASAEYFCDGSVRLLASLGADGICFGCENCDEELFWLIADIFAREPEEYAAILHAGLSEGMSFPAARSMALNSYLKMQHINVNSGDIEQFISTPNNILGIEYTKSIIKNKLPLKIFPIKRTDEGYHSCTPEDSFASARAIREMLLKGDRDSAKRYIPAPLHSHMDAAAKSGHLTSDDFSILLKYKLISSDEQIIGQYMDVSGSLADRIYNNLHNFTKWNEFCSLLKTKNITFTRISRALMHILLEIYESGDIKYARLLGFKSTSSALLSEIKRRASIPVISKLNASDSHIDISTAQQISDLIRISNIYESVRSDKYSDTFVHELARPFNII